MQNSARLLNPENMEIKLSKSRQIMQNSTSLFNQTNAAGNSTLCRNNKQQVTAIGLRIITHSLTYCG